MRHWGKQLKGHLHEKKRTFNKVPSWDSNRVYQSIAVYIYCISYSIKPPKGECFLNQLPAVLNSGNFE
jgi:hypothetical protein